MFGGKSWVKVANKQEAGDGFEYDSVWWWATRELQIKGFLKGGERLSGKKTPKRWLGGDTKGERVGGWWK